MVLCHAVLLLLWMPKAKTGKKPTLAQIIKIQTFSKFIHQIHQLQRVLKLQFNIIRHNQPKILWKWHFKKCIPKPSAAIAFEEELWRRPPWHCTNVSLSLKVAQGWWLVAWLCKTSLKNVSQGSSQTHLNLNHSYQFNSLFRFSFQNKTKNIHCDVNRLKTESIIGIYEKFFCVSSGLIFQTTGLFLTLINALVVASSQCQMTMVSYSNHTTKSSSSSNLDHINYILETIRISTHSTLWSTFPLCHSFNLRGFWDKFTFHPVFLA